MPTAKQRFVHYVRLYILIALALDLCATFSFCTFPAYRSFIVDEDRLLEGATAFVELGVFVYALLLSIRIARQRSGGLGWSVYIALVGLWSFLEDMSYGQRVFGFGSPVVYGIPIDGLHDFLYVGKRFLDILIKYQARRLLILVAVLGLVAIGLVVRYWPRIRAFLLTVLTTPQYLFFTLYALLEGSSAILDLDLFAFLPIPVELLIEETLELDAVVALLFCCIAIDNISRHRALPEHESTAKHTTR